jgi:hypothetical protein
LPTALSLLALPDRFGPDVAPFFDGRVLVIDTASLSGFTSAFAELTPE